MSPLEVGIIGIAVVIVLLFSGMPVSFVMFLVGFIGFTVLTSLEAGLQMVAKQVNNAFTLYAFSAIPTFVLMGYLASESGISERLFKTANAWVGQIRGGLAIAAIVASAAFGAICGSSAATVATIGIAAYPSMKEHKYDPGMSTACIAAGSMLGTMIPPSLIFVIYGIITENSIAQLFVAGFLPGILCVLVLSGTVYLMVLRKPSLGPAGQPASWRTRWTMLGGGTYQTIIIFVTVLGALTLGLCTPTEAGAVGVLAVLLVGAIGKKGISWKGINNALGQTIQTSAFIILCLAGVGVLSPFLAISGIPREMGAFLVGLDVPPVITMIGILLIYFASGFIIDPLPFVILTMPIFYPIVLSLGYDPIWFGVIIILVCGLGSITPPVAMFCYVISGITGVPAGTVFRGIWPFVVALCVATAILVAFPQIATFLPNFLMPTGR